MAYKAKNTLFYSVELYKEVYSSKLEDDMFVALVPDYLSTLESVCGKTRTNNIMVFGPTKKEAIYTLQKVVAMATGRTLESQFFINIRDHSEIYLCRTCYPYPRFYSRGDAIGHMKERHSRA